MDEIRHEPTSYTINFHPVSYKYRYCPRCRREWPAKYGSCPECVHWLGDKPMERIEWQITPMGCPPSQSHGYGLIRGSTIMLRLVSDHHPTDAQATEIAALIKDALVPGKPAIYAVADHGWLAYAADGLRAAFLLASQIASRLVVLQTRMESILQHCGRMRWGMWTDQYLMPIDRLGGPTIAGVTADSLFGFEPDNVFLCSEVAYKANRRWENFVCVPRRLLDGQEEYGYRMIDHKRASARDHAAVNDESPFVGRDEEIVVIDKCWKEFKYGGKLAIIAEPGSGKTRLIREWLATHPDLQTGRATFSLFGGDLEDFAAQLADLPSPHLTSDALTQVVVKRIDQENIGVICLDDVHWADQEGLSFLRAFLAIPRIARIFVILAARPSGLDQIEQLKPDTRLMLRALPPPEIKRLARQLITSEPVAAAAEKRAKGNPLFIQHFALWASEAQFHGGSAGPQNLHQLIAARISHITAIRMKDIEKRVRWGDAWERRKIAAELDQLEAEIGLWLDRLETGDYADRIEVATYLVQLERLNVELIFASSSAGRARSRSSRLREAIERLFCASAGEILHDLRRRAASSPELRESTWHEAAHAGDILADFYDWPRAQEFYELAASLHPPHDLAEKRERCRLHTRSAIEDDDALAEARKINLNEKPNINPLDLPYAWINLAHQYQTQEYYRNAAEAATAINDRALAKWANAKAMVVEASEELPEMRS